RVFVHKLGDLHKISFSKNPKAIGLGVCRDLENVSRTFNEDPMFIRLLQTTLGTEIYNDEHFAGLASSENQEMFMQIYDLRAAPPSMRIPSVDDTLGTVRISSAGEIVPGSYESNRFYRILTNDGFPQLTEYLHKMLVERCE
ncbi:hypothetical protein CANCADRAFT_15512, partial [Tortispora caseinolytica NRRL Y-17796]